MPRRGMTRRQRKVRGGGKGLLYVTWTLHGDQDEEVDLNGLLNEYQEGDWDVDESIIKKGVEDHVVASGYKNPAMVADLTAVEVEFDGEDGPAVPDFDITFPGPEGAMDVTASFKLEMSGGRKKKGKKTRGRRRHTRRRV